MRPAVLQPSIRPARARAARPLAAFVVLAAASCSAASNDVIFLENGSTRPGIVREISRDQLRLEVPLPPRPGDPGPPPRAVVSIPRPTVLRIEFGADPVLERALAGPPDAAVLAPLWAKWEPFLATPKSPSGRVALAYGDALLAGDPASAAAAFALFTRIEKEAWDPDVRERAKQGRLRAMIATGRAAEAVGEAKALAAISEDPAVLIQAKYILASAAEKALRELVEDNPRWQEDIHVLPERNRLYNEAIDEYLYPALFLGSEASAAARGLWGAAGVYRFAGEDARARECARDLVRLYPGASEAAMAEKFLAGLPPGLLEDDPEAAARAESEPTQKSPQPTPGDSPKPKKNSKKKNENS